MPASKLARTTAHSAARCKRVATTSHGRTQTSAASGRKQLSTFELDATNFIEKLEQRRVQKGLFFSYHVDPEEGLCRVFWESDDGAELWQRSNASVLIIDTKHGTQRYGLKLGLMVSPDRNGATRIIARSLLRHEDATSFGWVFEQFSACFRSKPTPKVVFSDSDPAIAAALAEKWAAAIHLLCIRYVFKVCWNETCGEWLCLCACVVM